MSMCADLIYKDTLWLPWGGFIPEENEGASVNCKYSDSNLE